MTKDELNKILEDSNILNILSDYNPVIVGTIPIGIDIPGSDIDIACCSKDLLSFMEHVRTHFSGYVSFSDNINHRCYVASLIISGIPLEIYAENIPSKSQNGYRHMIMEDKILRILGNVFREEVIALKRKGHKTEPAFGLLLGMKEPYSGLLQLEKLTDQELQDYLRFSYKNS